MRARELAAKASILDASSMQLKKAVRSQLRRSRAWLGCRRAARGCAYRVRSSGSRPRGGRLDAQTSDSDLLVDAENACVRKKVRMS